MGAMNEIRGTMKAVQLDAPGPPQALHLRDLPMPQPSAGWVRIRVEAFGLNRSELHLRLGLAEGVTFPRVPGIECAGVVDAAAGTSFHPGQQVVAMMGGMGRIFDGGYAQYTVVPGSQVIPIRTNLPWEVVGALPEMLQTAYGSLTVGLDLQRGQSLLIRGGTSSVGLAAAGLAREMGATVLATTRRRERLASLAARGEPDRGGPTSDEQALSALQIESDDQRPVGRLQHFGECADYFPRQVGADRDHLRCGHHRVLRVAPVEDAPHAAHHRDHLLAGAERGAGSGIDDAGAFDARHAGEGDAFGKSQAQMELGAVQSESLDADADPPRARLRDGQVAQVQRLGRTRRVELDSFHRSQLVHGVLLACA